jgi:mono/diheme cytochrome c family protein
MRKLLYLLLLAGILYACQDDPAPSDPAPDTQQAQKGVVDGIDTLTGLIAEGDYMLVKGNCLACHGANLITQQGATAEGWLEMIHWMQEKQGLWDLGKQEGPIVEYLATYYAPEETGRRPPLDSIEWYILTTD